MDKLDIKWILRHKLYHLPFWAAYHFIWWIVFEESMALVFDHLLNPHGFIIYSSYVVFQTIGVYICFYYLIPKYLIKNKYLPFVGYLSLIIVAMALAVLSAYIATSWIFEIEPIKFYDPINPKTNGLHVLKYNTFPSAVASMTLAMSIKFAKHWIEAKQRQQELEKEKLETELKFLKSQFNPHFLFNTINTIFVLINKNTDLATESLAKFSGLLRYQLYECNEHQIPLARELNYLDSFIELEKLRQNDNFQFSSDVPDNYLGNLSIAPFILTPFIENAFKHISRSGNKKNWIYMKIEIDDCQMFFKIANSINNELPVSREAVKYGGLGLQNVKRRLDLLYPRTHSLSIGKRENEFYVELHLTLEKKIVGHQELIKIE